MTQHEKKFLTETNLIYVSLFSDGIGILQFYLANLKQVFACKYSQQLCKYLTLFL